MAVVVKLVLCGLFLGLAGLGRRWVAAGVVLFIFVFLELPFGVEVR